MRHAQRVIKRARGATDAGLDLARAVVAHTHAHKRFRRAAALAREQLDDAANRVRAVHRSGWATQHFDAVDLRQRNLLPHRAAGGLRVHPHAVDVNRREAPFGPTQKHIGRIADAAVARDLHTWQARQHVHQPGAAAAFDGAAVHDGHVGHQIGQRLLGAGGGHHGFAQRRCVQILCQQHRCSLLRQRGQRAGQRQAQGSRAQAGRRSGSSTAQRGK